MKMNDARISLSYGEKMVYHGPLGQFTVRGDGKPERRVAKQLKAEGDGAITNLKQLESFVSRESELAQQVLPRHWRDAAGSTKPTRQFNRAIKKLDKTMPKLVEETLPSGWEFDEGFKASELNDQGAGYQRRFRYESGNTRQLLTVIHDTQPYESWGDESARVWLTSYVSEENIRIEQSISIALDPKDGVLKPEISYENVMLRSDGS